MQHNCCCNWRRGQKRWTCSSAQTHNTATKDLPQTSTDCCQRKTRLRSICMIHGVFYSTWIKMKVRPSFLFILFVFPPCRTSIRLLFFSRKKNKTTATVAYSYQNPTLLASRRVKENSGLLLSLLTFVPRMKVSRGIFITTSEGDKCGKIE